MTTKSISDRDKSIIDDYRNTGLTLRDIGDKHGISHERVRQILKKENVEIKSYKERKYENGYKNSNIKKFLKNFYIKNNRMMRSVEFYKKSKWPDSYIKDEFDSYHNLLAWCELPLPKTEERSSKNYSDEYIIRKVKSMNEYTEGDKLSVQEYRNNREKFDLPYTGVIYERFDNFKNLMDRCGIKLNNSNVDYEKVKKFNDYNLLQKMYYNTVKNNHYPTINEWNERFDIPAGTCRLRFRSWRNFQNKAMIKFSKTLSDKTN